MSFTSRYLFLILLICVCSLCLTIKTHKVFYVMGSDGIYIIDPLEAKLVKKITNSSSPGLCTRSNNRVSRSSCYFSMACVADDSLFVADAPGSAVKVIDLESQKKTETIPTDPSPYGLYSVPWLKEIWVHSWKNSTFDVIKTEGRNRTHTAVRAHIKPGWTHGIMLVEKELQDGKTAYISHMWNPGVHKINLQSKAYSGFINLTLQGCIGTYGIVFSPVNNHLFLECRKRGGSSLVELDVANNQIVKNWDILGSPFVSPNGRYVIILHAPVNETSGKLLDSRMNILEIERSGVKKPLELYIPGGVSRVAFYPKNTGKESYYAFVTLKYANKIALVDLSLIKNDSKVQYIKNVGELNTAVHGASRPIVSGGKWIVSPASKSNTLVIIDADTRKVHGNVSNVHGGRFTVWIDGNTNPNTNPKTNTDPNTNPNPSKSSCLGPLQEVVSAALFLILVVYMLV